MGGFSMKWTKWELSLAVGLAVMLLFCAARGTNTLQWWSAAFSPLCDGWKMTCSTCHLSEKKGVGTFYAGSPFHYPSHRMSISSSFCKPAK